MPLTSSIILPHDVVHTFVYWHHEDAPSGLDKCDGQLHIWACLKVEYSACFDEHLTVRITRWICPQKFTWHWMIDTDGNSEVEGSNSCNTCKKWEHIPHPNAPSHHLGSAPGIQYETRAFSLDKDPPYGTEGSADDEDYAVAMRPHGKGSRFAWQASVATVETSPGQAKTTVGPIAITTNVPPITAGVGLQQLPFYVEWALWLTSEDDEIKELGLEGWGDQLPPPLTVGNKLVRVIAKGYVDPVEIPNMPVKIEESKVAQDLFENPRGFAMR